jgi:iron complex outermembrane receptor protein
MLKSLLPTCALAGLALAPMTGACAASQGDPSLADYSLEQLSQIVVTSVSRQDTTLNQAPASIYVISGIDIRRSGATSIPEALRLAPNLQVSRSDGHTWAISARGFSSTLANKLLVLIDGRSVYSPLFSGVFWDMQDVVMSDIERIEVISGPGATIWGANAVNGVINIITRSARDTRGGQLVARRGRRGDSASVRYGGKLGGSAWYRAYAKTSSLDDTESADGRIHGSGWRRAQAGFRIDWEGQATSSTVSGDAYQGRLADLVGSFNDISGANLLARANTRFAGGELRLQAYLDHTARSQPRVASQRLDTLDLEAQHDLRLGQRHNLTWGGGYRYSLDRIDNGARLQFIPATRNLRWANVFAQDEVSLTPALRASAGLKLEHNVYTGTESLPSLRLAWSEDSSRLLWTALSRTVRAPSRIDRDLYAVNPNPAARAHYIVAGGPDFQSETARVAELGYRAQPNSTLSYSATLFYSQYERLRTLEPHPGSSALFENLGHGIARGVELWGMWQPLPSWRLAAGGVLQHIQTGTETGSMDASARSGLATNDPRVHWTLRSSHDLPHNLQADLSLRYVASLPLPSVPGYHELDARLAWQPRADLELALSGRNLLHASHVEYGSAATRQVYPRFVMLSASLKF